METDHKKKHKKQHKKECIRESRGVSLADIKAISTDITNKLSSNKDSGSGSENSDEVYYRINNTMKSPKNDIYDETLKHNNIKQLKRSMSYDDVRISLLDQSTNDRLYKQHTPKGISQYYNYRHNTEHITSDDKNRKELLWTNKIEDVLNDWHSKCIKSSAWHFQKAKKHKMRFYILGIPSAIIPMSLAAASDLLGEDWKLLVVIAMIISGSLNIVSGFLNPGKRLESHLTFSSLYSELAVEITSELVKPQSHRQAADVFIQRIMDNYNSLNNRAPPS